jgi:hypothetical protein
MKRSAIATVFALFCASAFANEVTDRVPPELRNCASIQRNTERLACFDRAIAVLEAGDDGAALAAATPESSFGLLGRVRETAPKVDDDGGDLQSVQSTVKAFSRSGDGSIVIHLDNGQSWRQLSGGDTLLKAGDSVTITRAALGSFQMKVPSGRSTKVRRIR